MIGDDGELTPQFRRVLRDIFKCVPQGSQHAHQHHASAGTSTPASASASASASTSTTGAQPRAQSANRTPRLTHR